jgi:hypothetical protein
MPFRLLALNLLRWLREYLVVWGLLSVIYSLTVTLVLQPLLERALRRELPLGPLWAASCALLLVPGLLEALPLPGIPARRGPFFGRGLLLLYLRHDLRRSATWLVVVLSIVAGSLLPAGREALWVLFAQLPVQRALYSVHRWRGLSLAYHPSKGASQLLLAIGAAQLFQLAVAWGSLGAMSLLGAAMQWPAWLALGPAALGAVLAGGSMAFEGDSGRPWLVNFLSLAAGTIGGYLCYWQPWLLLVVGYFCLRMDAAVAHRLHSVEHLDEDSVIP